MPQQILQRSEIHASTTTQLSSQQSAGENNENKNFLLRNNFDVNIWLIANVFPLFF